MPKPSDRTTDLLFLPGGGEMGALIRDHDWQASALGPPSGWPQSLRTMLSVCLHAPMFAAVLWGPELRIFYNDVYIPVLDDRHPWALGRPVAEVWGESWGDVAAPFRQALATGQGFTRKAFDVPVVRDGVTESVYWDIAVTPIRDQDGHVVGLFTQSGDITEQVRAERAARDGRQRLQQVLSAGDGVGTWEWDVATDTVRSDARFARLYGVPPELAKTGAPIAHFFRCIHPDDAGRVEVAVADALRTGDIFAEEYRLVDDAAAVRWVLARGQCERGRDGTPRRFPGVSFDITARKVAEARQAALLELGDRLRDLTDPAEITHATSEVLGKALGVSRVGYGIVDLTAETITIDPDWHVPGIASISGVQRFREYGSYVTDLKRGETVAIGDAAQDPRTRHHASALTAMSARAFVNMPLVEQGGFVAMLFVTCDGARNWTEDDLVLMREVAERLRLATERVRTERALAASDRDLRLALAAGKFGTWKLDLETEAFECSPLVRMAYGFAPDQPLPYDALQARIHPDDQARRRRAQEGVIAGERYDVEYRVITPAGETRWVAVRAQRTESDDGRRTMLTGITTDITERKRLEHALGALNAQLEQRVEDRTRDLVAAQEALRQSQKMEAVGQLTGGIAHDFNNLLQGITGSLQIARRRLARGRTDDLERFMSGAIASADRAATLTHRLLAFSRRQPLDPDIVCANHLVASLEELFHRTLGSVIDLRIAPAADLWNTLCDPNQLESALLNLVLNARDAMASGGTLTIETSNVAIDAPHAATHSHLRVGDYICIAVGDSGIGMAPETMAKAFEPFFTTKPVGRGTGLGLSMVYGFAGQSGGAVEIESALGVGSTVSVFLPRHRGAVLPEPVDTPPPSPTGHAGAGERILVVEDDRVVRAMIVEVLGEQGYVAITATDGHAGLELLRSDRKVDLLVTDIGLPGINGRDLAAAGRIERPGLKVLFMTGYAETAALAGGFLEPGMALITKPFDVDDFAERVRAILGAR